MAMPTRKPLKLLAMAITNNARPYTTNAVRTKIFRRPIRSERFPAEKGSGDDDGGLDQRAQEYLLRHLGLGGADLVQQVVGLVGRQ